MTEIAAHYHAEGDAFMTATRDTKRGPQVTVGFAPDALSALRQVALLKGVKPATLVRMWVIERLRQELPGWSPSEQASAGGDGDE